MNSIKTTAAYDNELFRGLEEGKPWDLQEKILQFANKKSVLADIGCGTAKKLLPLAKHFKTIFAVEPNPEMREKAEENIASFRVPNIKIIDGIAKSLPFDDNSIDVITCMMGFCNTQESYRVLKPGGVAIVEILGEMDKRNLKECFGNDEYGPRGQQSHLLQGSVEKRCRWEFTSLFSDVEIQNGFWPTFYTKDGLSMLFEETPTIRNYHSKKDAGFFSDVEKMYTTTKGIVTEQNRILIVAKK